MFIYRQNFTRLDNLPVYIPVLINSDRIVFEVFVPNARRNWFKGGSLTRTVLVSGIGFALEQPKTIQIAKNLLEFKPLGSYLVQFTPYKWITEFTISIWKL